MVIFRKFYIFKPYPAYGNRAEDLLYAAIKAKRENLILCLIYNPIKGLKLRKSNNALCKNVKSKEIKIVVIPELALYIIHIPNAILRIVGFIVNKYLNRKLGRYLIGLSDNTIGRECLFGNYKMHKEYLDRSIDWPLEFERNFDKSILSYASREWLEQKIPILTGRNYVCLHVRTAEFHGDGNYGARRNFNFENLRKSIDYLNSVGYLVVRIGAQEKEWINVEGCINLDGAAKDGELLDIGVIEHCSSYIGGYSGPMDVALLFGKKILGINLISLSHCCWYSKNSRFIAKKVFKNGAILSLEDQIKKNIFEITGTGWLDEDALFIENTEDEILNGVQCLINERDLSDKQIQLNQLLKHELIKYMQSMQLWPNQKDDTIQKMRWRTKVEGVKGGAVM